MAHKSNIHNHLEVTEHKRKISKLEKEVRDLEEKLHHLEDENHLLHHRVKTLTKDVKIEHKSKKITKPIVVPKNDPFYTELGDKKTLNARDNFFTFFDYHWHSVIKSKMLWILLVALPILFTTLYHIAASMEIADSMHWMNQQIEAGNLVSAAGFWFEIKALTSFLSINIVNWLLAIPILVFTCILLPSFITISREDNLLKRLTINSMNRSQIFWFYILSSTLIFSVYLLLMLGVWLSLLTHFAENLAGVEIWEHSFSIFDRIETTIPPQLAGNGAFSSFAAGSKVAMGTDVFELFAFSGIAFLGLTALGFNKSMTAKTSRSLVGWGTGVFIFSQFSKLSVGVLDIQPFKVEMGEGPELDVVIGVILFCLKWMFIFTIPTVVFVALTTVTRGSVSKFRYGGLEVDEFANAWLSSPEKFFTILQTIVVLLCIGIFIYVWLNKDKIIKFEAAR